MPKLLVVLPAPRTPLIDGRVTLWLASLCRRYSNVVVANPRGDSCDANRNAAIHEALTREPDVQHVFFLDADTEPPADAVERLLALHAPIACGVTPMRRKGAKIWNVRALEAQDWWPRAMPLPQAPFPVRQVGGTTVLVERRVLEILGYPWFHREYFMHGPVDGEHVKRSGDVYFSDRCREEGFAILCDPNVRCHHYKICDLLEDDEPPRTDYAGTSSADRGPVAVAAAPAPVDSWTDENRRLAAEIEEMARREARRR